MSMDYSITLSEGERLYEQATLRGVGRFESAGLRLPDRPRTVDGDEFDGQLPSDVNNFSNRELGDCHVLMCRWADYVHSLLTVAKADCLNAQERLKMVKALVRKSKQGPAHTKDDLTLADSRYVDANTLYIAAKTYAELVEGQAQAASRDCRVVSRLIETKRLELEANRRGENIRHRRRS